MIRKPIARGLFVSYFIVMLTCILIISHSLNVIFKKEYLTAIRNDLVARTTLILMALEEENFKPKGHGGLEGYVRDLGKTSSTRITWIDRNGDVVADSDADPAGMENHANRPEVRSALQGKPKFSLRYSRTLGEGMQYYAYPVKKDTEIAGVIRAAIPVSRLEYGPTSRRVEFLVSVILTAIVAATVSFLTTRGIAGALQRMQKAAMLFSGGNYKSRSPVSDIAEIGDMANTLNHMMDEIEGQFNTITQQTTEQSAILESMNEGVIAVDNDDRVMILNTTAAQMLDIKPDTAKGNMIQEVMRNSVIQRFISKVRAESATICEEFTIRGEGTRIVQATGKSLIGVNGAQLGILVVLNDVTQFRKLENIRKDFVANVSHELRTPITSIKGYTEALLTGIIDDNAKTKEFLAVIERQADRLGAIIDDLLSLSALEQNDGFSSIAVMPMKVCDVISAAVVSCMDKSEASNTRITVDCDPGISANLNGRLMEQAIFNLIDNAVKYTPNGDVNVSVQILANQVCIQVKDTGCGISEEDLPRIFERFYRVDKARSRKLGGTGLGLSIVKHIVAAHRGHVEAESTPGVGSTFSIYIPLISDHPQNGLE